MSSKDKKDVDLGRPPIVLGLGAGLHGGGFCKCGRFASQLDHGLCIYCRTGGTPPLDSPTAIPTPPDNGENSKK